MARMVPNHISSETVSNAEKKIFNLLKNCNNTNQWIVLHSLILPQHEKNAYGEADFVVFIPEYGFIVLEVKGGRVYRDEDGVWHFVNKDDENSTKIQSPFDQAKNNAYSIRNYLMEKFGFKVKNMPITYGCLFPDCVFYAKDASIEWDKSQIYDKSNSDNIYDFIKKLCKFSTERYEHQKGKAPIKPSRDDIKEMVEILRPNLDSAQSLFLNSQVQYSSSEIKRLTSEQIEALDSIYLNDRIVFLGPAGTGKTIVALESLQRITCDNSGRYALLCYNSNLAEYLRSVWMSRYPNRKNITISTFGKFVISNLKRAKIDYDPDLIYEENENNLTSYASDKFYESLDIEPIELDALIIDEAQDLISQINIDIIELILKNGIKAGRFIFCGDFDSQNIYQSNIKNKQLELLESYCPYFTRYPLTKNCRNALGIAKHIETVGDIKYKKILSENTDKSAYFKLYESRVEEANLINDCLNLLIDKNNINPSKITILSPKKFENTCLQLNESLKNRVYQYKGYYDQEKKVKVSTIQAYKGLENEIIILCDFDSMDNVYSYAYIGFSRAKSLLYVFMTNEVYMALLEKLVGQIGDDN